MSTATVERNPSQEETRLEGKEKEVTTKEPESVGNEEEWGDKTSQSTRSTSDLNIEKNMVEVKVTGAEDLDATKKKSWAQVVESDEEAEGQQQEELEDGEKDETEIPFFEPETQGGKKLGRIQKEDVENEANFWKNSVTVFVLGMNVPYRYMSAYINKIWGKLGVKQILKSEDGFFMVRFEDRKGQQGAIMAVHHYDNKPMIVKEWNANQGFNLNNIFSVPVWIQLPGLDLKYWGSNSLGRILSAIGRPRAMDQMTLKKQRLQFARVLIDMEIQPNPPEIIQFISEDGNLLEQKITYEWKPIRCGKCKGYGHGNEECRFEQIKQAAEANRKLRMEKIREQNRKTQRDQRTTHNDIVLVTTRQEKPGDKGTQENKMTTKADGKRPVEHGEKQIDTIRNEPATMLGMPRSSGKDPGDPETSYLS